MITQLLWVCISSSEEDSGAMRSSREAVRDFQRFNTVVFCLMADLSSCIPLLLTEDGGAFKELSFRGTKNLENVLIFAEKN